MSDAQRQAWNAQHKEFRAALRTPDTHAQAIELFLHLHAAMHSAQMVQAGDAPPEWSYADEVLGDMTGPQAQAQVRRIPQGCEYSIAWHVWHMARIEDITMAGLVAGQPQLFVREGWAARINAPVVDTGNAMTVAEVTALSAALNLEALCEYRTAVGRETRAMVARLTPAEMRRKVEPARLQQVMDDGSVVPAAWGIVEYWSKRTVAELLLMPPTRHNLVHLNESLRLKQKRR